MSVILSNNLNAHVLGVEQPLTHQNSPNTKDNAAPVLWRKKVKIDMGTGSAEQKLKTASCIVPKGHGVLRLHTKKGERGGEVVCEHLLHTWRAQMVCLGSWQNHGHLTSICLKPCIWQTPCIFVGSLTCNVPALGSLMGQSDMIPSPLSPQEETSPSPDLFLNALLPSYLLRAVERCPKCSLLLAAWHIHLPQRRSLITRDFLSTEHRQSKTQIPARANTDALRDHLS